MNKTIKIIDLLNKIANGEETPKKIRIRGVYHKDWDNNDKPIDKEDLTIWHLDDSYFNYDYYSKGKIGERKDLFQTFLINRILNNEVEIIEDNDKLEKIKWEEKESLAKPLMINDKVEVLAKRTEKLKKSLNEIIGVLSERNMEKH